MSKPKTPSRAALKYSGELENGLRNYWYPVLLSENLPKGKPVAIKRLGEDLVLWRGSNDEPHLFVDYCPHRGAPLSLGSINDKGRLQCWYHGFEYDDDGQCRHVPFERQEDGPLACRIKAQSYPTEERHGFIWAYIGEVEKFPPPPLTMLPEVEGEDYHAVPYAEHEPWNASWILVLDNANDPAHAAFLHSSSAAPIGASQEELFDFFTPTKVKAKIIDGDIRLGGHLGCRVEQIGERKGSGDNYHQFYLPITIKLNVLSPDGKGMVIVAYFVPIDDQHTQFYQHTSRKMENDAERPQWEEMCVQQLAPMFRAIYAEDGAISESQKSIYHAWGDEHLIPTDVGVMQVRRLLLKAYEAQQAVA